jgi:hypothetical protein
MNGTYRAHRRRPPRFRTGLLTLLAAIISLAMAGCASGGDAAPALQSLEPPSSLEADPDAPSAPVELSAPPAQAQAPTRTVEDSGGFKLAALSSAACTADAPFDWAMQAPDRSDRADVISPDGSMYAGYGIQAVNTALADFAYAYDPPLSDPNLYSDDPAAVAMAYGQLVVASLGGSPDLDVDELVQPTPDYLLLSVAGSTHRGAIFFRAAGFPGDGYTYSYALPMYFAFTTADLWESEGLLVARVAASIRCSTQFQPPNDYPVVEAGTTGDAADANGDDAGYNPQLGTEDVNDPTTGENYLVDPSTNWSETGPDGPGYYVQKGGYDYQKLEPGRVD